MNILKSPVIGFLFLALASAPASGQSTDLADPWLSHPVDDRTFQAYLEFFAIDDNLSFDAKLIDAKEEEGIRKEHISFQSTSAERVFCNFYTPVAVNPVDSVSAIIYLHGGGPRGKDSSGVDRVSKSLVRNGSSVLTIDMKHFGERNTGLMTSFTEKEKHESLYNQPSVYLEWVTQTVKDVRRSYDFLVKEKHADAKRIALMGMSRGAVVGIIAGAVEKRLAAVVLRYAGHFDAMEKEHLAAACPANYIGRISPRPLLTINGTRDRDFDRERSVLPLFQHAREPKKHLWTDGGHGYWSDTDREAMRDWVSKWLKETLE